VAFLKGKTMASPGNDHVPNQPPITLPPDILSDHSKVTLCCNIFYILVLPFSLSVSCNIHFLSCRPLPNREKPLLRSCISADINTYQERGFSLKHLQNKNACCIDHDGSIVKYDPNEIMGKSAYD
jgi:hypothetical protein